MKVGVDQRAGRSLDSDGETLVLESLVCNAEQMIVVLRSIIEDTSVDGWLDVALVSDTPVGGTSGEVHNVPYHIAHQVSSSLVRGSAERVLLKSSLE